MKESSKKENKIISELRNGNLILLKEATIEVKDDDTVICDIPWMNIPKININR